MEFRKKPVVIEARQLLPGLALELAEWCDGVAMYDYGNDCAIRIHTLEGDHVANNRDWIIKGVKGEFYPCNPDIFELTYEAV